MKKATRIGIRIMLHLGILVGYPAIAGAQMDSLLRARLSASPEYRPAIDLQIAGSYFSADSAVQAHEYAIEALELAEANGDRINSRKAHNLLGYIYLHWDDYQNAIASFLQCLELAKQDGNQNAEAGAWHGLCRAYAANGNFEEARRAVESGLKLAVALNDTVVTAVLHNSYSILYSEIGDYESALSELQHYLKLSDLRGDRLSKVYALNNIGEIYLKTEKFDLAEQYLLQAVSENASIGNAQARAATLGNLGVLYQKTGNTEKAMSYLEESMVVSKEQGFRRFLIDNYQTMAEIYEEKGDFRNAYRYHKEYADLKDSLFNETRQNQIDELILRYQRSEDKQEFALLEQRSQNQRLWFILLISVSVLSILVLALLLGGYRLRIRLHNQETLKLSETIDEQNRELSSALMQSSRLREVFTMIDHTAADLAKRTVAKADETLTRELKELRSRVKSSLEVNDDWESIKFHFDKVHPDLFDSLQARYPLLTRYDLKLCAYIKMNLSTKDIARLLNISDRAVQTARYRIKKKMELGRDEDLIEFIRKY